MIRSVSVAGLFALLGAAANAGTILNDPAPDLQTQIHYYQPIGQSFTAIDSNLISIGFRLGQLNPSFPNDPIKLELYAGTGTGGTLIASRTLTLPIGADYSYFTDFDLTGTVLSVGAVYSAALSVVGNSPLTGIVVDLGHSYTGGLLFRSEVSSEGCGDCDLAFRVIGGAVPEPASWALLIAGFGFTGGAMRVNRAWRRVVT